MMRGVLLGLALSAGILADARAEAIDAGCSMPWWNMEWNAMLLGPVAQSFVASADRLDFVDLLLAEGPSNSTGVTLALDLHAEGLTGPVLARSTPLDLADGANDVFRFRFDPPVQLVVDSSYAFELVRTSPTGYVMVRGANDDPCPDVHAWIGGTASAFADLWFAAGRRDEVKTAARGWGTLKARYADTRRS